MIRTTICTLAATAVVLASSSTPHAQDAQTEARFARIDAIVDAAIERRELPGAVVLVGEGDRILYLKAFGRRAVEPTPEAMTVDTIFDAASLTKVVATTTSVMQLVEQGYLRLRDPVAKYVPAFNTRTKNRITIGQLLTHTSGLAPDLPLNVAFRGTDEAIRRAGLSTLAATPGTKLIYSDINFFLLGYIVQRVTVEPLAQYVKTHIFDPLKMQDTGFEPAASLVPRIAPTERCAELAWPCSTPNDAFLRGTVHDPTARRMGNVAGHAGLFSTAADLSRFCRMLLNGGSLDGAHVLSPATVERMIAPSTPAGMKEVRGLGWDIDTGDSGNRGDLFPVGTTFGHTGWTGTSLWMDPRTKSYVIFLSNRVHPNGRGDVVATRGLVANVAVAVLSDLRIGR
jgi:CubicO group peptidase (beta-lactamase class C family)